MQQCWLSADELHELLQKEKEQGVQPDSEHAVDAYLKANVADTPDKVITEVSLASNDVSNLHNTQTPESHNYICALAM